MATNINFSFCVAGCLHFGGPMRLWNSFKDTYHIMDQMASLKPDMLFLNGSHIDFALASSDAIEFKSKDGMLLISNNIQSEKYVNFTYSILDTMAQKVSALIFRISSENTIPDFFGKESAIYQNAEQAFLQRTDGNRYYAFQQFGSLFICLDSESHPRHRGRLDKEQMNFLLKLVPEAQKYFKHVFCFIHLSAWRYDEQKDSKWFEEVHPILKEAGVKYVFGACLHSYQHEVFDGINYITSGSCGNNVEPPFPHFLKVEVKNEVQVKVYRMGFPLYFPMEMQLSPQPDIAFIERKIHRTEIGENHGSDYKKAIDHFSSGNYQEAQEIWKNLKYFPDFNPQKMPKSIKEHTDSGHNDWLVNPEIMSEIRAKYFK